MEKQSVAGGTEGTGAESQKVAGRGEIGVGIEAMIGNGGSVGSLGAGLDVWYRPFENVAFGAELQSFFNDNGADPHYLYGCVASGTFATAFVEGRLFPGAIVSPFLRAGIGAGAFNVIPRQPSLVDHFSEVHPILALAVGPQLTVWHLFLRVRGTLTVMALSTDLGLGAELGAVF